MRAIITTAAVFAALAIAGSARAASIRECGSRPAANGYQSIENITSRNVSCSQARHVAFVIYREVGPDNGGYAVCSRSCVVRWTGWRRRVYSPVTRRWYRISYTYYTDGSLPDYIYGVGPNGQWAK